MKTSPRGRALMNLAYYFDGSMAWTAATLLLGLAATIVIVYILNQILMKSFKNIALSQPKLITTLTILRRLVIYATLIVGVMASVFTAFPGSMGAIASIFVAAGFASIVIGLAAQSSLSNIISGLIISVSQPFSIGDALMFRQEYCYVEDVRLMHTILRIWDNRRLVVPNSVLQNEVIVNYSMRDPSVLAPVYVQVGYESNLKKAMQIMVDTARRHPGCVPDGDLPKAAVMEFQDSGIQLRLLTKAKDQSSAFEMIRDLLVDIKREFDEQGIEIPYPKREVVIGKELLEKISDKAKENSGAKSATGHNL
jgi:small conductance mechanosensitive channel